MKVYVSVKQVGKRKEIIAGKEYVLAGTPSSLRDLITEIIRLNVVAYNKKPVEPLLMYYLSPEDINNQAAIGKVGFGERHNPRQADLKKAVETAILAYQDGIYRVFQGDNELTSLDEPLDLKEDDLLTFIRLTMLAGRMW